MTNKFVAILNKEYELKDMASALGHVAIGIKNLVGDKADCFFDYIDADGIIYPSVSKWPFIVLKASSSQLRKARSLLTDSGMPVCCYTDTMFYGGHEHQVSLTKNTHTERLKIIAICTFGEKANIDVICKKYSLWN